MHKAKKNSCSANNFNYLHLKCVFPLKQKYFIVDPLMFYIHIVLRHQVKGPNYKVHHFLINLFLLASIAFLVA